MTEVDAAGHDPAADDTAAAHPVGWRRSPTTSAVQFSVDPHAEHPPFEQLKAQVIAGIASGDLIAGTKLPTMRALATELGIAPNTVARAYRELEADDLIETRGRNGTLIKAAKGDAAALAQLAAQEYAARVKELGVPAEAGLEYVRVALQR
jgi:DNA-binding transcriptional regulator YhcF (GntR family)